MEKDATTLLPCGALARSGENITGFKPAGDGLASGVLLSLWRAREQEVDE